jgi:putative chitinase
MADISKILGGSIKEKILGVTSAKGFSKDGSSSLTKVIAKNFMALPGIARDLNVARQNIQTLVELEGGKPASSPDAFFLKEKEREKKLEVETAERKPKKTAGKALAKGLIMMGLAKLLKIVFASFSKVLLKYLAPAVILGVIFVQFKDAFVEWATGLFDAIKTKFDEFTSELGQWFTDSVATVGDKIKDFVKPIVDTVSGFFSKVGDFFVGYFEIWRNVITAPMLTVKKVYDSFMSGIDKLKSGVDKVKNFLGFGKKEAPVDDTAERQRLLRQQKEAQETERIRKLEKEKQYTGDDEIVRARLGLPEKTETMRREAEMAKAAPPVETAPTPAPIIVPSPMPSAKKAEAKPPPPTPEPKPAAGAAEKPTAQPAKVPGGTQGLVVSALNDAGITSPKAHANVLATVKAESNFVPKNESLFYRTAEQIMAVFGKKRIPSIEFAQQFVSKSGDNRSEQLANEVYKKTDGNSAPGDGFKYRGRGFIQHTGKNQYKALAEGSGIDVLKNPDALNSPEVAAKVVPWFFLKYKRLKPEDMDNMSKVNKAVAFADPTGKKAKDREASAQQIYASMSSGSGTQVASASTDVASGQRQQAKPKTPVVVNAPTTNNLAVSKNQVASSKRNDVGSSLANAAA